MDFQTVLPVHLHRCPFILRPLTRLLINCFLVVFGILNAMIIALAMKYELKKVPDNETKMELVDNVAASIVMFGLVLIIYFTVTFRARRKWKRVPRVAMPLPPVCTRFDCDRRCSVNFQAGYRNRRPSATIRMNNQETSSV